MSPKAGLLASVPQQFLDNSGKPLGGGSVGYYIPGGNVLGQIWVDDQQAIAASNPAPLDASGRPTTGGSTIVVYGSGVYRQDVKDVNGVLIASALVQDEVSLAQETAIAVGVGGYYLIDGGTASNIQVALPPGAPAALADLVGVPLRVLCKATSSGPATIQIANVGGTVPVTFPGGTGLGVGALQAGGIAVLVYDGVQFELTSFSLNVPALLVNGFLTVPSGVPEVQIPAPFAPMGVFQSNVAAFVNVDGAISNLPAIAEAALAVQFRSSTGNGIDPPDSASRLAGTFGIRAFTNSGNVTALETHTVVEAGACQVGGVVGLEADLTNLAGHDYGNAAGEPGIGQPAAYGLVVSGASANRNTAAIFVTDLASPGQWNRGLVFDVGTGIVQSEIEGYASTTIGYLLSGSKGLGLDTSTGTFSGAAIRLGNAQALAGVNVAANAQYDLLSLSAANTLMLGQASGVVAVETLSTTATLPGVDNVQALGGSINRWTVVYAVNGTINTSDPAEKTDIAPPPEGLLEMVLAIKPITFRWRDGGLKSVETEEEKEVEVTEAFAGPRQIVVGLDGKAVLGEAKPSFRPVFREIPVFNPDGTPAEHLVEASPEIWTVDGQGRRQKVREAQPERRRQMTHKVPLTERRRVKVAKPQSVAGKRLHWGFDATEVKRVIDAKGVDFGGFVDPSVTGQAGPLGLRPGQMLALLWGAFQELAQAHTELEEKVKLLEGAGAKPGAKPL